LKDSDQFMVHGCLHTNDSIHGCAEEHSIDDTQKPLS